MARQVELAAIHGNMNVFCLDRIGGSHADIAGAHAQCPRAIEYALVERRVQRGEVGQRGHIHNEAPPLASDAAGIRQGRTLHTAGCQGRRTVGRAHDRLARLAARRSGYIHLGTGLHHHAAIITGQFDDAAGRCALDVEESHRTSGCIGNRIRAQRKIAGRRRKFELPRRQDCLGIEHQVRARQRPTRPQRCHWGERTIRCYVGGVD